MRFSLSLGADPIFRRLLFDFSMKIQLILSNDFWMILDRSTTLSSRRQGCAMSTKPSKTSPGRTKSGFGDVLPIHDRHGMSCKLHRKYIEKSKAIRTEERSKNETKIEARDPQNRRLGRPGPRPATQNRARSELSSRQDTVVARQHRPKARRSSQRPFQEHPGAPERPQNLNSTGTESAF